MPLPKFKHTTRAEFKFQFFEKVGDSSRSFWTDSEANVLLNEALYTFGAISQSWKNQIEIKTEVSKSFYDISTDLFANQELTAYTLTYQFILDAINLHLIENISLINPTSEITNLTEILNFAQRRINQFQFETGLVLSKKLFTMNPPNNNAVIIDDEIINLVRIAFVDLDELSNPKESFALRKEDEDNIGHFNRNAFNSITNRPTFYTSLLGNLNTIKIYPLPANLGELEIISVNGIARGSSINLETVINLPNNLIPYIKWGVLADIYSKDGVGYNPAMASYCNQRWEEGLVVGNNYTSILEAKLNGLPLLLDSIESLDNSQFGWQNNINSPSLLGIAGYNLFATNCSPDDVYSLLMFSVTNAYIPTNDDDFIDIKLEYIEPLINYCVHLANVKNGYEAIGIMKKEKDEFVKAGINHNVRLLNRGINFETLVKKTKLQEEDETTRVKEEAIA
jgi:hypothetical protein